MDPFESLSEKQRAIVFASANIFVVKACAGSGKTYTVAARIAHLLQAWPFKHRGIAVISFTNTAWKEIAKTLDEQFGISNLGYPHFLGTIDRFINRFIFLPFGHKIMGCKCRPKLVGLPHGHWIGNNYSQSFFDKITYNINGDLYFPSAKSKPKGKVEGYAITAKKNLIKAGYCTQSDANFITMKLLQKYAWLSKAICSRFNTFIVDEAQDTSEIQMSVLDSLIDTGLKSIVLIGDPDQAIFEWNDAKPELFINKWNKWKDDSFTLNESRRSSQKICDVTCKLSSLESPPVAITENVQNYNYSPQIYTHKIDTIKMTIDAFIEKCIERNITPEQHKIAIIFRSKSFFNDIFDDYTNKSTIKWTDDLSTMDFCKSKYLFENGRTRLAVDTLAKTLVQLDCESNNISKDDFERYVEEKCYSTFYNRLIKILLLLPSTKLTTLENWITQSNSVVPQYGLPLLNFKNKFKNKVVSTLFSTDMEKTYYRNCLISTVHGVKGETFDATLVLLKKKGIGLNYTTMLSGNMDTKNSEELRTVYVAITRPRKILDIAVPDDTNKDAWTERLLKGD